MVEDRVGEAAVGLTKVEGGEEVEIKAADLIGEIIMAVAVKELIRIKKEEVVDVVVEGVEATGDHGMAAGNQLP